MVEIHRMILLAQSLSVSSPVQREFARNITEGDLYMYIDVTLTARSCTIKEMNFIFVDFIDV